MAKVAILSAGPSLRKTWRPDGRYDVIIAVNAAAVLYPADWWSCMDDHNWLRYVPAGRPRLFAQSPLLNTIRLRHAALGESRHPTMLEHEHVRDAQTPPEHWDRFSATAALGLASHLNARRIDCYGVDHAGTMDVISEHAPAFRDAQRWQEEIGIWQRLVEWLGAKGVEVNHAS